MLRVAAEVVVAVYVVVDGIVAPLFGPVMRFLSSLGLIRRIEAAIARLPPYVVLTLLLVPFIVAEFAKAYGIYLIAEEQFWNGAGIFVAAYIISILVCQRIFLAGREPLMTIGWFKVAFERVMRIKARVLDWLSRTRVWRQAEQLRRRAAQSTARMRTRLQALLRLRAKRPVEQP